MVMYAEDNTSAKESKSATDIFELGELNLSSSGGGSARNIHLHVYAKISIDLN